jgi:hypothetical protein
MTLARGVIVLLKCSDRSEADIQLSSIAFWAEVE